MRVVAGTHGGRRLSAPRGLATRPTADRVRESLFALLGDLAGARVLDLFAGSGALGIEALSRGAASAVFVDHDPTAVRTVRANLEALGLDGEVQRRDALVYLRAAARRADLYDLVFLDPPYGRAGELGPLLSGALAPVLAPDARVIGESDRRAPLPLELPLADERRYGDTIIRIHAPA